MAIIWPEILGSKITTAFAPATAKGYIRLQVPSPGAKEHLIQTSGGFPIMGANSEKITSAMQWQEAWKGAHPGVCARHATAPWEFPADSPPRVPDRSAIDEWKDLLRPHAGKADLGPLDQLLDGDTRVVVTGQQAGALMGPLYVIYKALAAKYWAGEYTRLHGKPCLAVFWVASDDHDLGEIVQATWLDTEDELQAAPLAHHTGASNRSIHREPIDRDLAKATLSRIRETTRGTEFREDIMEDLKAALSTGNFESQFLELACRWLLPLGVYPIVPRLGFLRRAAIPLFQREVETAGQSSSLAIEAGRGMESELGMPPPLHRGGDELNFFLEVGETRCRVVRDGDVYIAQEPVKKEMVGKWTREELISLLHGEPERFSPNTFLRPLVQDAALPTVAYIGGPTEVVYHAQIAPLYTHFSVPRPAVFPRPNVFLLESRHTRALDKLGVDAGELLAAGSHDAADHFLTNKLASSGEGNQISEYIGQIDKDLDALATYLESIGRDTAMEKAMEKLRQNMTTGAEKLRERHDVYLANRDANLTAARDKLMAGLFPGGIPQERAVGAASPLLINHGRAVLGRLFQGIDYKARGFQVLALNKIP